MKFVPLLLIVLLLLVSCSAKQNLELEKITYPDSVKRNEWFTIDIPLKYLDTNDFYSKAVAEYLVDGYYEMNDGCLIDKDFK